MRKHKSEYDNSIPHIVYDCSIENLAERREKAIPIESTFRVSQFIGCSPATVVRNAKPLGRKIKGINGKLYAVRVLTQQTPEIRVNQGSHKN